MPRRTDPYAAQWEALDRITPESVREVLADMQQTLPPEVYAGMVAALRAFARGFTLPPASLTPEQADAVATLRTHFPALVAAICPVVAEDLADEP